MTDQRADSPPSAGAEVARRTATRKAVVALTAVLIGQALFALCLVSAQQLLVVLGICAVIQGLFAFNYMSAST